MAIRVLIAKTGLDGHDRGAILVTRLLREQGIEAEYSGVRRTPEEIASLAVRGSFDCIGLSSHAGAHLSIFPRVIRSLSDLDWQGRLVIAGGLIPSTDIPALLQAGVHRVFPPETPIPAVAQYIRSFLDSCLPSSALESSAEIR
jgi:methylmalonyl-CoA mutase, C-terminal domain